MSMNVIVIMIVLCVVLQVRSFNTYRCSYTRGCYRRQGGCIWSQAPLEPRNWFPFLTSGAVPAASSSAVDPAIPPVNSDGSSNIPANRPPFPVYYRRVPAPQASIIGAPASLSGQPLSAQVPVSALYSAQPVPPQAPAIGTAVNNAQQLPSAISPALPMSGQPAAAQAPASAPSFQNIQAPTNTILPPQLPANGPPSSTSGQQSTVQAPAIGPLTSPQPFPSLQYVPAFPAMPAVASNPLTSIPLATVS